MPQLRESYKNELEVMVVSRSRWEKSSTIEALSQLGKPLDWLHLVVPQYQLPQYRKLASQYGCNLLGCPDDGISMTRKWCGTWAKDKFIMLDDDLRFCERVSATDWHLHKCDRFSLRNLFNYVTDLLGAYVHVAIGARQGNNRQGYPYITVSRPLRALAYRKSYFLKAEHGRTRIMEDFDVTMQLLRMGYANAVITRWTQDQQFTQMKGGCSDYRTLEVHNENVLKFAELHKPFVRLRQANSTTVGEKEFGKRQEAVIYWRKAYESSSDKCG